MKKCFALLLALCFAVSLVSPLPALADAAPVGYMPGVTEEMAAVVVQERQAL